MTSLATYFIPVYPDEQIPNTKRCVVSWDLCYKDDLYYNWTQEEYFKKELINEYVKKFGLSRVEETELIIVLIRENTNK